MEKGYCVYMHVFPNGKKYVGITCCKPNRRWQNGYGYKSQRYLWNAISKYGWDNIEHIILKENVTAEEAGELEALLVNKYRTNDKEFGYNIRPGGEVGYHLSDETKRKISEANSGKNNGMYGHRYTDEDKKRIAQYWLGRHHTEESRKKMSDYAKAHPGTKSRKGKNHPMYGKHHSEEARRKMSESAKNKYANGYKNQNIKKVNQYTLEGEYMHTYDSIAEAGAQFNPLADRNISSACRGAKKTAYGYIWKYVE